MRGNIVSPGRQLKGWLRVTSRSGGPCMGGAAQVDLLVGPRGTASGAQENHCQPCADTPGFKERTAPPPAPSPPARRSPVAPDTRAAAVSGQRLGGLPADAPASRRPHAPRSPGLRPRPRARDAPTPPRGGDPHLGPASL